MGKELTKKAARLGMFLTAGVIAFVASIYLIGKLKSGFGDTVTVFAKFSNASGLKPGNNVMLSGMHVGTVSEIKMIKPGSIQVELVLQRDLAKFINKDAMAVISGEGIMGNKLIDIVPGKDSNSLIADGDILKGKDAFSTNGIMDDIDGTTENVKQITQNLNHYLTGNGTLGTLVTDSIMAIHFKSVLSNLNKSSYEFSQLISETRVSLTGLAETARDSVMKDLAIAGKNTALLTQELNSLVEKLNSGDGAIGALLNDSTLANDLKVSLTNVKNGSEGMNEIIAAAKKNFLIRRHIKKDSVSTRSNKVTSTTNPEEYENITLKQDR